MLRKFGHVLVVLGVFLMVLGAMSRFYAYPKLAVAPLDTNASTAKGATQDPSVAVGNNVEIFSIAQERQITTTIVNTRNTVADADASKALSDATGRDLAIYETFAANVSKPGNNVESAGFDRVAFDRKTGEAFNCAQESKAIRKLCGEATGSDVLAKSLQQYVAKKKAETPGDKLVNIANFLGSRADTKVIPAGSEGFPNGFEGLYFKLPFHVQKQTYQFWDGDVQKATPLDYVGTEDIDGLTTYKFQQKIAPTKVGMRPDIPVTFTSLSKEQTKGLPQSLELEEWYSNTRTLWVEPETGAIVKGSEDLDTTYRCPESYSSCAGETAIVATRGTVTYDDATIRSNVDMYKELSFQLKLIRVYLPWGGVIVGLILALLGLVMVVRGRKGRSSGGEHAATSDPTPSYANA